MTTDVWAAHLDRRWTNVNKNNLVIDEDADGTGYTVVNIVTAEYSHHATLEQAKEEAHLLL